MNKYIIEGEDVFGYIGEMDNRLLQIEVKGDSVTHLYLVRSMLKSLHDNLKKIEAEEAEKEG